jgi:hypothetical protein
MFHLCNISQELNDFLYADLQPSFIDEPLASLTGVLRLENVQKLERCISSR